MKEALKEILKTALYLLSVVCIVYFLITYVGQRTIVDGESMIPTLHHQDNLIVDKLSYRFNDPERYDIIVFPYEYAENVYYIKRIIGLPGERVRIDEEGYIYINDEVLMESYGREVIRKEFIGLAASEITLGDNEYFVLGDNRNNSRDSRWPDVGNIHREDIIGRAWIRIWPLDDFGKITHQ